MRNRRPVYQNIDRLSLREVGITPLAQAFIFFMCFAPFAGLIISAYYSVQGHAETRVMGRTLLGVAMMIHAVYACIICPALIYLSLG